MAISFVTAGNFNIDNVVTADGRLSLQQMGGNAVYSAVGAHIWSADVGIISNIPSNYPVEWLSDFTAAGIDARGVATVGQVVQLTEWFFYSPDGSRIDRVFSSLERALALTGNQQKLTPAQTRVLIEQLTGQLEQGVTFGQFHATNAIRPEQIPADFWPIRGLHLAPGRYDDQLALAQAARSRGAVVTLDPAMYVQDITEDRLAALLSYVDVFLPSQKELAALYPHHDLLQAVRRLANLGPAAVVVKLGGDGALIWDRARADIDRVPAFPTQFADLTGAGDAFCGGFLVGMVETGDPLEAAKFGAVSASLVIEDIDPRASLNIDRSRALERLDLLQLEAPGRVGGVVPKSSRTG